VPEKGVFFVVSSDVAFPKENVEHFATTPKMRRQCDIVNIPEETHISVVLLII
jgi:hypothetical protein